MDMDFKTIVRIHFVGIGGISMSGLARMMLAQGKEVSGSDKVELMTSDVLISLQKEGAIIYSGGHAPENVSPVTQLVVYSAAVPEENPELVAARERGIATMSRARFLGEISRGYTTIAVSGTHGKTTTSAMLTKVMKDAGLDPTALVGSVMTEYGSNFIAGKSKYLVVEACEYERQFLDLEPHMLVITNIEEDHLDYYEDIADIRNAFRSLALKVPEDGLIVYNAGQDEKINDVVGGVPAPLFDYTKVTTDGLDLHIPGSHNVHNAQAVLAVADALGVSRTQAVAALNDFRGTWRRFEYKGQTSVGADVYDDYAHHPTAIKTTLAGAREKFGSRRIIAIFQPHLYSRTHDFLKGFAESFGDVDEVIITDIYPAREKPGETLPDGTIVPEVHARDIVAASTHPRVSYTPSADVVAYLRKHTQAEDVIMLLGAGDVYMVAEKMIQGD